MKNILEAPFMEEMKDITPFMVEMIRTATNMYDHGWDERNGGNISLMLDENLVADYVDAGRPLRTIPTGFTAPELEGKYFLVTGTGKYFKNVQYAPEVNLGIVRLKDQGRQADLLWGFADGGQFTSEFPAHMMSHVARLKVDPKNRVVMHCHPANLLAMTYVHDLDEKAFTRTLWQMCTECIVVFPEGVNVLPWMLCGTNEIGEGHRGKDAHRPPGGVEPARHLRRGQGSGRDLRPDRDRRKGRRDLYEDRPPAPPQHHHRRADAPAGKALQHQGPRRVSGLRPLSV